MKKLSSNIVLIGFSTSQVRKMHIPNIGEKIYLDNMDQMKKYRGFLLIINNVDNIRSVNVDKMYRKYLSRYGVIWLYNEKCSEVYHKWSRIYVRNGSIFTHDRKYYMKLYKDYKFEYPRLKLRKKEVVRSKKLKEFRRYLKKYTIIKSHRIANDLKLSSRFVSKYMKELNILYNNVAYDYSRNEWYIIKK